MSRRDEIIEAELKNSIQLVNGGVYESAKLSATLYDFITGATDKSSPNSFEKMFQLMTS